MLKNVQKWESDSGGRKSHFPVRKVRKLRPVRKDSI